MSSLAFDRVMDYLKTHGLQIGQEAADGSAQATGIISAYKFVYACPSDPGGQAILIARVEEYLKTKRHVPALG